MSRIRLALLTVASSSLLSYPNQKQHSLLGKLTGNFTKEYTGMLSIYLKMEVLMTSVFIVIIFLSPFYHLDVFKVGEVSLSRSNFVDQEGKYYIT